MAKPNITRLYLRKLHKAESEPPYHPHYLAHLPSDTIKRLFLLHKFVSIDGHKCQTKPSQVAWTFSVYLYMKIMSTVKPV